MAFVLGLFNLRSSVVVLLCLCVGGFIHGVCFRII